MKPMQIAEIGKRAGLAEIGTKESRDAAGKIHALDKAAEIAQRIGNSDALERALVQKLEAQRDFAAEYSLCFPHGGDKKSEEYQNASTGVLISAPEWCIEHGFSQRTVQRWLELLEDDKFIEKKNAILQRCWELAELFEEKHNHRAQGTGQNEWYTPAQYIEAARRVLGEIDLDPASSDEAQETVQAKKYFTAVKDGLKQKWRGRVWMNPPYAQPAIGHFMSKLVEEVAGGSVTAAIALTHNYTDTAWFHKGTEIVRAICFTRGRIKFVDSSGNECAPTQGQAFFYYGSEVEAFQREFSQFGFVVMPHD